MSKSRAKQPSDKLEYMPLYPKDFIDDTQTWSDQEVGFYFRLLCYNWTQKELPSDPMRIMNIAGGGAAGGVVTRILSAIGLTRGSTTGTTPAEPVVTTGEVEHPIFSHDRLTMWQTIKSKFTTGAGGGLVNKRVEFERNKILQYFDKQRENSLKAVAAKKKKREEYLKTIAAQASIHGATTGTTTGSTIGATNGTTQTPTGGIPSRVPIMVLNNSLSNTEEFIGNSEQPPVQPVVQPPVGTLPPWVYELPQVYFEYYQMTFEELQDKGSSVGAGVTKKSFQQWKRFVQKVATGGYSDFFNMKFLKPKDFPVLTEQKGFTEDRWEETLAKMCGSTIDPSFNPFHRIPQFMKYKSVSQPPVVDRLAMSNQPPHWAVKKAEQQLQTFTERYKKGDVSQEEYDFFVQNQKIGKDTREIMQPYVDSLMHSTNGTGHP